MCRVHSLVGQAVSPAKPYNAGIPKKVTPFPSKRCLRVPDLASLGITTRQSGFDCVPNTGHAFLAQDRVLDRRASGPLWLSDSQVADLVARAILIGDG